MSLIAFFIIVCLIFVSITIISCVALNIKIKRQPLPVPVIGNEFCADNMNNRKDKNYERN